VRDDDVARAGGQQGRGDLGRGVGGAAVAVDGEACRYLAEVVDDAHAHVVTERGAGAEVAGRGAEQGGQRRVVAGHLVVDLAGVAGAGDAVGRAARGGQGTVAGAVVADLEQRVGDEPRRDGRVRADPPGVEEQRRGHLVVAQDGDQIRVVAAAAGTAAGVERQGDAAVARRPPLEHAGQAQPPGPRAQRTVPTDDLGAADREPGGIAFRGPDGTELGRSAGGGHGGERAGWILSSPPRAVAGARGPGGMAVAASGKHACGGGDAGDERPS